MTQPADEELSYVRLQLEADNSLVGRLAAGGAANDPDIAPARARVAGRAAPRMLWRCRGPGVPGPATRRRLVTDLPGSA